MGGWVVLQRTTKDNLSRERKVRLEALPGWSWDLLSDQWDDAFCHLKEYVDQEGHTRVPQNYKTADGYRLGAWVSKQRAKKESMPSERKVLLEAFSDWCWAEKSACERKQWDEWFNCLKEFADREGHCLPTAQYKTADGYGLGSWVSSQRSKKNKITPERKAQLEELPSWSWDPFVDKWEEGFRCVKKFADREGHTKVPDDYQTLEGYRLGGWVCTQRIKKNKLSPKLKARLEALPSWSWSWDPLADVWEDSFCRLKEFADREGHTRVPHSYISADETRLGYWVATQRYKKGKMTPDRKARLDVLPGWSWDALSDKWEEGFHNLREFAYREGRSNAPSDYKTPDGYSLGQWISIQRQKKDRMSPERKARLEELPGWSWDPLSDMWEEGFHRLKEFVDQEGHAKISQNYKTTDGYRVGAWASKQRAKQESMSSERKSRLEALPGWIWRVR